MDDIVKSLDMVGKYMATVIAGLFIHALIIIPLLYLIVVRKNPIRYFIGLRDAIITAFGTSSRLVHVHKKLTFLITNYRGVARIFQRGGHRGYSPDSHVDLHAHIN